MFSYIAPDKRVPQDHPLRRMRTIVDRVLEQLSPRFNQLYARAGRPVDRSGEAAASLVTAVAILGAKRAAADGATGLQPAVPLVCGADVFQGPGAHAGSLKHSFKNFWEKH